MNSYDELIDRSRAIIAKEGHLVVSTGNPAVVSYTAGLTPRLGYELFVVGLPPPTAMQILNSAAERLQQDEWPDGEDVQQLANMPLRLRFLPAPDTAPVIARLRMLPALGYEPQRIRQLLFPDVGGLFPDDQGYSLGFNQTLDEAGV